MALLTGVALRFAAIAGTLLVVSMWAAEWPLARFTSDGTPTGSTNPLLDYHIVFALALIVIAAFGTASTWGLGRWWAGQPLVAEHPVLR